MKIVGCSTLRLGAQFPECMSNHLRRHDSNADFCRSLWLRFLSIVVFLLSIPDLHDSNWKVNMMSLHPVTSLPGPFPKHSFVGSV